MKKIILISSMLLFFCINEGFSYAKLKSSQISYMAYCSSPNNCCYPFGNNCYVVIIYNIADVSVNKMNNNSFNITINFSGNINQSHTPNGSSARYFSFSPANYSFGAGEYLTIDECSEYPELNGRQLNLTGLTTDSQGSLSLTIQ